MMVVMNDGEEEDNNNKDDDDDNGNSYNTTNISLNWMTLFFLIRQESNEKMMGTDWEEMAVSQTNRDLALPSEIIVHAPSASGVMLFSLENDG